jgi:hypothetical protein
MTNAMIRELADARRLMAFVLDCTTATVTGRVGQLGSDVEESPSGRSTVVRASHALRIDPSSVERLRAELGEIAERSGGEYDGWEASLPRSQRSEQPD